MKAAKKKFRETGEISEVHFKTKRDPRQSINIPGSAILPNGIYPKLSGPGLRYAEDLPSKRVGNESKNGKPTMADGRLLLENGRWYLCVPETVTVHPAKNQGRIVAIDPGIRAFATFYSQDECGQIASGDYGSTSTISSPASTRSGKKGASRRGAGRTCGKRQTACVLSSRLSSMNSTGKPSGSWWTILT